MEIQRFIPSGRGILHSSSNSEHPDGRAMGIGDAKHRPEQQFSRVVRPRRTNTHGVVLRSEKSTIGISDITEVYKEVVPSLLKDELLRAAALRPQQFGTSPSSTLLQGPKQFRKSYQSHKLSSFFLLFLFSHSTMSSSRVYLITGCASGLGLALAHAALQAGHKVIATSRKPHKTPGIVEEITSKGGYWATLDVTSPSLETDFQANILPLLPHGKLDVLINNAGIAPAGVIENLDLQSARAAFETNFWGVLSLSRLVIPIMRIQGGGDIINISSTNAIAPFPLLSVYSASKAAVDALTTALAGEVAMFGIRVLLVTPAGIRTNFVDNNASGDEEEILGDAYKGTPAEAVLGHLRNKDAFKIDPEKAAATIIDAVERTGPFVGKKLSRLPLGADAVGALAGKAKELEECSVAFGDIAKSVAFDKLPR